MGLKSVCFEYNFNRISMNPVGAAFRCDGQAGDACQSNKNLTQSLSMGPLKIDEQEYKPK